MGGKLKILTADYDLGKDALPSLPADYIEIARSVVTRITINANVNFLFLVKFGAIFQVTGFLYEGKNYGIFRMESINNKNKGVVRLAANEYEYETI